jgi:signal transduction histidine kinase
MMSHELRTPLNAIAGYAELMELGISGPVSDTQRDQLGRIRRSQRHLLGIIEDLLDLSRLEHGKPADIELGPVPIHDTLGNLEPLIAPQLKARNLSYIYNPAEGGLIAYAEPGAYRADRAQPALERDQVHLRRADASGYPVGSTAVRWKFA